MWGCHASAKIGRGTCQMSASSALQRRIPGVERGVSHHWVRWEGQRVESQTQKITGQERGSCSTRRRRNRPRIATSGRFTRLRRCRPPGSLPFSLIMARLGAGGLGSEPSGTAREPSDLEVIERQRPDRMAEDGIIGGEEGGGRPLLRRGSAGALRLRAGDTCAGFTKHVLAPSRGTSHSPIAKSTAAREH